MTYLITTNGTRRQLPRPMIEAANERIAVVHRPAWDMDGQPIPPVSFVELDRFETYRVDGVRLRVYDRGAVSLPAAQRVLWLDAPIPAHLDTHDAIVSWLIAGLASDGEIAA